VSIDNQGRIGGIANTDIVEINFTERQAMLENAQDVLGRVAQYTQLARMVQRVCDHPAQKLLLHEQITDLKSQQFLPPQWDSTASERTIQTLTAEREEASSGPAAPGTVEELRDELAVMTSDA